MIVSPRREGGAGRLPRPGWSTMPSTPRTGVGSMSTPEALVVERDVPADDRQPERAARLGEAAHALDQLPHDLCVLRVAEVEAVDDGGRPDADTRQVRDRLGQDQGDPAAGIERAPARVGVRRDRDALVVAGSPGPPRRKQRGVATGADDGVQEQLVVVLAVDPRGVDHEPEEVRRTRARRLVVGRVVGEPRVEIVRAATWPVVARAVVGEGAAGTSASTRAVRDRRGSAACRRACPTGRPAR